MKIILLSLLFISCSTLKKTIVYSSLAGGTLGASAGYALSPDDESRAANAIVFGVLGAGISALAGYAMYEDDPRNQKLEHMLERPKNPNEVEIDLGGINIDANLSTSDIYKGPKKELPKELKGKVKEQYIIKYESKERYVNQGDKTYYIPSFEIYEHAYDEAKGEVSEQ